MELTGDALELAGDGLIIVAYTADAGSTAEDQLNLLATWTATRTSTQPNRETGEMTPRTTSGAAGVSTRAPAAGRDKEGPTHA